MAAKFLIAIAAVVAVMAALVLLPGTGSQGGELDISYTRDHMARAESGALDVAARDVLTIKNDGSATYRRSASIDQIEEREFSLSNEEMKRLKAFIFETGFMQIPVEDYEQREGLANFTKYQLAVEADGNSKTITWVNPEAYNGTIPPVIANTGSRLDAIIMAGRG